MAKMRFMVEVSANGKPENVAHALNYAFCVGLVMGDGGIYSSDISVTPYVPNPVDAHGEHGVADGVSPDYRFSYVTGDRLAALGMDDLGPAPLHQPEKLAPTCACYVGASAQPYAHEPSCPVHPRYVHIDVPDADKAAP